MISKPIVGLLDRRGIPPDSHAGVVRNAVLNADWMDLQPTQAGLDFSPIELFLQQAKAAGLLGVKLRLMCGIYSPVWVCERRRVALPEGSCPQWWTRSYLDQYDALIHALAKEYDGHHLLRDITISGCMTVYAEPLQRQASDLDTRTALLAAGITVNQDVLALQRSILSHGNALARTRSSFAFTPYQDITGVLTDNTVSSDLMVFGRAHMGDRFILENNSARVPPLSGYAPMYRNMQTLGPTITFQTATSDRVGDLCDTIRWCADQGASSVELPSGYVQVSPAELGVAAAGLHA